MKNDLLFFSPHCYLDTTSGAAVSARELLLELAKRNWRIRVVCGPLWDAGGYNDRHIFQALSELSISPNVQKYRTQIQGQNVEWLAIRYCDSGIDATIFSPQNHASETSSALFSRDWGTLFLKCLKDETTRRPPDIYMTYGGFWFAIPALEIAKNAGATSVFYLCNHAYQSRELFQNFDHIVVPSQFTAQYYRDRLNVSSVVVPPLINEERVVCDPSERRPRFLTFINPSPEKGVYFFAGILRDLEKERPDIPVLIVEGRRNINLLSQIGFQFGDARRRHTMRNVGSPKYFYRETKLLLVPSLFNESFGRVAVEAALNGIPALCSRRGAFPEILPFHELLLDVPARFTPDSQFLPDETETRPWLDAIDRHWDRPNPNGKWNQKLRDYSQRWNRNDVVRQFEEVFE